ncbi:carbohydrate ABC transporter permease [Paenibacillus sp. R14(2021)]|uniref:carbohydrate ABC transporter permease n=1 Tax=Paenibacillus sp. R14(2021) TaxID=2859228 RepID=UPI001C6144C4|nr:sugar ABC transporter permease [Paenibacillus sp. R14(2021)]
MPTNRLWMTAFLLPCLLMFVVLIGIPLINVVWTSFADYSTFSSPVFSGWHNYDQLLFHDADFWAAVRHTLLWVTLQCTVGVAIGVTVALMLFRKPAGWKFFRAIYMIPSIIPTVASGIMFYLLLNPEFGIVKPLQRLLGAHGQPVNLFGNSSYAFWALTLTWIFYSAICTVIVMAELGTVSGSLLEAARIDGASRLQIDLFILVPLLRGVIGTCVILAAVSMITQFDTIFVTTRGGPGASTLNLSVYLYNTATLNNDYGMTNAISVMQILIGLLIVFITGKAFKLGETHD